MHGCLRLFPKRSSGVGALSGSSPLFDGGLQKSYNSIFMTSDEYVRRPFETFQLTQS